MLIAEALKILIEANITIKLLEAERISSVVEHAQLNSITKRIRNGSSVHRYASTAENHLIRIHTTKLHFVQGSVHLLEVLQILDDIRCQLVGEQVKNDIQLLL